jgi:hypothetical protein
MHGLYATGFGDYLGEGVWHIWIGFDHILFLVSLLLPSVFVLGDRWVPAARFRDAFWDVFKVAASFTIAHSVTLSLATLSVIELPSRLVESAIALSVVLAALNNVWPLVHRRRWLVAFGFGLIHGFGFALRRSWAYRRVIFVGGSAAIAFVAAIWMVERVFDLKLGLI